MPDPDRFRLDSRVPNRADLRVFGGYCVAAAVYIAIGVTWIDFLFSFWVGLAYLVVTAWAVPTIVRRLVLSWAAHDLEPYAIQKHARA